MAAPGCCVALLFIITAIATSKAAEIEAVTALFGRYYAGLMKTDNCSWEVNVRAFLQGI